MFDPLISRYLDHMRVSLNRSPNTIRAYRFDLTSFANWMESQGVTTLEQAAGVFPTYVAHMSLVGRSRRTRIRHAATIRRWYAWLDSEGVTARGTRVTVAERPPELLPRAASLPTILALIDCCGADDDGLTDRAIFELMYSTGMRVSEVAGALLSELDLAACTLRIIGKGGRERIVPFGAKALDALQAYLHHVRPQRAAQSTEAIETVFLNRIGGVLTDRAIRRMFKRRARTAGVAARVHPHAFRHACATHMRDAGADLADIQELLGHRSINTTLIYAHVSRARVRETQRRFHPRG